MDGTDWNFPFGGTASPSRKALRQLKRIQLVFSVGVASQNVFAFRVSVCIETKDYRLCILLSYVYKVVSPVLFSAQKMSSLIKNDNNNKKSMNKM